MPGFEALWDLVDVIQCITLRTRPERMEAATAQFAAVGLADRVHFLVQEPDREDGKRGCFCSHQQAARRALELGARRALTFEDDVEFTSNFTPFAAARAAKFLRAGLEPWEIFFLGHFPRKMEMTAQRDIVKVRSMDGHAYMLSLEGMHRLCALDYRGDQVACGPSTTHHVVSSAHAARAGGRALPLRMRASVCAVSDGGAAEGKFQ